MNNLKVSIIGAGNVAWHLAPALEQAGFPVMEVCNRSSRNAKKLIDRLYDARYQKHLDFSESLSDLYLLAVSDDSLQAIASEIILPTGTILVHTSGTMPLKVLEASRADHLGILYPLQTFSRDKAINLKSVPFFVEGNSKGITKLLQRMSQRMSRQVVVSDSELRTKIHVAAVFANNFTNHMVKISSDLMKANKLDGKWLFPLIEETLEKALAIGPDAAQTGPAIREDHETIKRHLKLLKQYPEVAKLYKQISQSIIDSKTKK